MFRPRSPAAHADAVKADAAVTRASRRDREPARRHPVARAGTAAGGAGMRTAPAPGQATMTRSPQGLSLALAATPPDDGVGGTSVRTSPRERRPMTSYSKPPHNFDLETLYTFLLVVEHQSFSVAAEMMHKTTSAISYRIKNLEEILDIKLINRTTHSVTPTAAGLLLIEKAKYLLDWQQDLPRELKKVASGVEPSFTLVFNNLLYESLGAARLLVHLYERFPGTIFRIERAVNMGVWDYVIHENAHAGIGAPGLHAIDDTYHCLPLGLIEWDFVCAAGHPLVRRASTLTEDDVRRCPVINIEDTSRHLHKRQAWRLTGQQEMLVPDMETKINAHLLGLGVGFLPKVVAQPHVEAGRLHRLNVPGVFRAPSPMSLVRPKNQSGVIDSYVHDLFRQRHPLIQPFTQAIGNLFPVPTH
ncbi:hypothetical protein CKO37_12485 [Rubrivivax gelatinosus]|nr:hypothetical protein [Rubrivivax gelatinosus]